MWTIADTPRLGSSRRRGSSGRDTENGLLAERLFERGRDLPHVRAWRVDAWRALGGRASLSRCRRLVSRSVPTTEKISLVFWRKVYRTANVAIAVENLIGRERLRARFLNQLSSLFQGFLG